LKKLPATFLIFIMLLALWSGSAAAAISCRFSTKSGSILFGLLDRGNPVDRASSVSMNIRCSGSDPTATYLITTNDGQYPAGPGLPRMRNIIVLTEYLPYSLSYNPPSGTTIPRNTNTLFTVTATVLGLDYMNAYVGDYEDIIEIYIDP